jgi:glutamate racemase
MSKGLAPLGVFDSGLGGLTVVRAMLEALPSERIVYLGDTARVPYGTRSAATVVRYARSCARVLSERKVKALIVACNTVSAVALEVLRAELDLPVIGVVEPGARAAVRAVESLTPSPGGPVKIGVLGTAGTIASGAYPRAVAQISTRFEVIGQAAPLLVPLVEEGWLIGMVPELAVHRYVEPLMHAGAGVIVLGCTHYPLLKHTIAAAAHDLSDRPVPVVDSAEATALRVAELMGEGRIAAAGDESGSPAEGRRPLAWPSDAPRLELLVTDLPASFDAAARRFLGTGTPSVTQIDLDLSP